METCVGENLAELLLAGRAANNGGRWPAVLTALGHAGRWPRRLQRQTASPEAADAALRAWHSAVEADLHRCRGVVPDRLLVEARVRLTELEAETASASRIGVLHHGDFGPGNVFVGAERLEVIDFEGSRPGLPYEDVAYFVVQLELFFAYPFLRRRRRQAVSAFLEGYLDGEPRDGAAYRMARIAKTLQIVGRLGREGTTSLAVRRRRKALRRMLEEALA